MSTKDSIFYGNGLHVYKECKTDEICLEVEPVDFSSHDLTLTKFNENYGSFVMPKDAWIQLAKNLLYRFDEQNGGGENE